MPKTTADFTATCSCCANLYVADGNDVEAMIESFSRVRDIDHPVVLHINTLKGKGYRFAECQKERFHWSMPFDIPTGELKKPAGDKGYDTLTAEHLLSLMKADRTVVGITAGTPAVFGFTKDRRERAGKQFIDMGLAEEQAVAMASAISCRRISASTIILPRFSCFGAASAR